MPNRKDFKPGTYVVTNSSKRTVVRDDVRFPGKNKKGEPTTTEVEVGSFEQWFRLQAVSVRDGKFRVKRAGKGSDGGAPPPPPSRVQELEALKKEELQELAAQCEVDNSGTKAEIAARIVAAEEAEAR